MDCILKNVRVFAGHEPARFDVFVSGGIIKAIGHSLSIPFEADVFDFEKYSGAVVYPGFFDAHVHLREPGFSYKETIASGTRSAAAGGFTSVCAMPNLDPVPDSAASMGLLGGIIEKDSVVNVYPYAAITKGEKGERLSDMEALAPLCVAFSDDGRGVQSDELMQAAMLEAKRLGRMIVAHCEDERLLCGGYIHDGVYARAHGHKGISSESEWRQLERDLALVRRTGCAYHMCHLSTKESLELIRKAKSEGLDVTCETAPHYLLLCDEDVGEDGRFRMNPPLRSRADREAMLEGVADGAIDMIATDHAPHSAEEKSGGLAKSLFGVVGLETAYPVLYTGLVKTGVLTEQKLISLMSESPARRFGKPAPELRKGGVADLTVFDLDEEYIVDPDKFESKGRATPFAGKNVFGRCLMTMVKGRTAWQRN